MVRNFRRTKFSQIGSWQRLHEKMLAVRRSQSDAHTGCVLVTPMYITRESAVMASDFSVEVIVRG